ncbi:MAG TPA: translocation/assembly module TamB domain-containing protein [Gemmatimonadales bacterium]
MRLDTVRVVVALALSVATLVTGFAQAGVGTRAGRAVVVSAAVGAANRALRGTVSVGGTEGSLLGGLRARDVALVGDDGRPLLAIGALAVRYRLADFLSGRVVLGELELDSVRVFLERRHGERFNYRRVLGLGSGGGGGRPPLVAFRNARVRDLRVLIRTADPRDSTAMVERTLVAARAELPYARVSSPLPNEPGVRLEFSALDAVLSAPALTVEDADGTLEIVGDTIRVDFRGVRLPGTASTMRGRFYSLSRDLEVDLDFRARRFASDDLTDLFDWLPPGVRGSGAITVRSEPNDVIIVRARDLELRTANGGTARGAFGMDLGPGEVWAARDVDLRTTDFDLAYLEGVLDTVPFDGRLSGRTRADGPRHELAVEMDWDFHDRHADSAETRLRGRGGVAFGVPGDIVFRNLALDTARVALATVRAISPAVALHGDLEGKGALDGAWANATFTGDFAHRREGFAPSFASGWVRLDVRRDTVGAFGSLRVDSLQWDALRPDYPTIPFLGAMAGTLTLDGYFDALTLQGALTGPRGRLGGGGTFVAVGTHLGARELDARFAGLELVTLAERLPGTVLDGRIRGQYETDTLRPPVVDLLVDLERSRLGGTRVDGASAALRVEAGVLVVDSLRAALLGAALTGAGRLALSGAAGDSLVLGMRAEAVSVLQPLLERLGGTLLVGADTLGGEAEGRVVVSGSIERPTISWEAHAPELRVDRSVLRDLRTAGRWEMADGGRLDAQGQIRMIERGERRFTALRAAVQGTRDSLRWLGSGAIGAAAGFRTGGWMLLGDTARVAVDSLVLRTADSEWRITPGARVAVTSRSARFQEARLATTDGRGVITVTGGLPGREADSLDVNVEGVQMADLWALLQFDPRSASGELSGTATVSGTAAAPVVVLQFGLRDAVFNEYRTPQLDGALHYSDQRVTGQISTWRGGTQIVGIALTLPYDLSFRALERRRLPGRLSVRARADDVDMGLFSAVSPLIRDTEGRVTFDFGVEGTWDAPELSGFLDVRDGGATLPALGVRHRQLHGHLTLRGDTIRVDTLSAASGTGTASVTGVVRLAGLTEPMLDVRIRASDFRAMDIPDFLTLVTSGEVSLRGPVFGATLTGAGTIPRGTLYFADIIGKNVVELSDTLISLDSTTAAALRAGHLGPGFENRFLDSLRVRDLSLTMGNDVHLRSTEADIFLSGQVLAQKEGDRYRLDGTLRTPRGTYQLFVGPTIRKQFTVTRGEVRYFGTQDLNAGLDIDARHQLRGQRGENVTVFVHVGGTMLAPELRLTSDVQPPLTDEEIISYLVIGAPNVQSGRSVGRYGIEESVSTLVAQVSGQLSSQLIGDLGVPLDYLEIRPQFGVQGVEAAGQSGWSLDIAIGRQISDRWFVKVNPRVCGKQAVTAQNLFAGSIEFRMSREWSLLASADPVEVCQVTGAGVGRLQFGFDLLWEKRF